MSPGLRLRKTLTLNPLFACSAGFGTDEPKRQPYHTVLGDRNDIEHEAGVGSGAVACTDVSKQTDTACLH